MKTRKRIAAALCALAFTVSCLYPISAAAIDELSGDTVSDSIELLASGDVTIDETTFPDAVFRQYVLDYIDLDGDGVLSQTERENIIDLTINHMGITDLTGIGYFPHMMFLECVGNSLKSLDVSGCYSLNGLYCGDNELTSLNLSGPLHLSSVSCIYNKLTSLDVSEHTELESLFCYNNQLETLNISGCSNLTALECWNNKLTSLDLKNNTKLTDLYCFNNNLTSLDLSSNTALENTDCSKNKLTSLKLGNNTSANKLYCNENLLTSLDLSNNTKLFNLECNKNQLTSLNTSQNTALNYLKCDENQLTSLDLSNNTSLSGLYCSNNLLTSLDLSNNTSLSHLECENNELTSLDLSKHSSMKWLECDYNPLTSINLHSSAPLSSLNCSTSSYSIGDVVNSYPLSNLPKGFDPAKASDWEGAEYDSETNSLINFTSSVVKYTYGLGNGSSAEFSLQINSYKNPNAVELDEAAFPDDTFRQYLSDNFDKDHTGGLSRQELDSVTKIYLYELNFGEKPVADLTGIEHFKNLKSLNCYNGDLTSLDLSKNTALETLNCGHNQLAFLDLTANTALKTLSCSSNCFYVGDVTDSYSLSNLPAGFDPSKASDWTGAEYDASTNSLKNFTSRNISYTYDCGNGFSKTFELYADSVYLTPTLPAFTAAASKNTINLKWDKVTNATKYKVSYRESGTSAWTEQETENTSLTLTKLAYDTEYEIIVTACGGQLWSDYTDEDIQTVTTGAAVIPDLPVFTAEAFTKAIKLSWNSINGVNKYIVKYRESGAASWNEQERTTADNEDPIICSLTSLTPGTSYEIIVIADSGDFQSEYTDADILLVTTAVPDSPLPTFTVKEFENILCVDWDYVSGGKEYRILYREAGTDDWSEEKNADLLNSFIYLRNLKGGTTYEIVVLAFNGYKWSDYTDADIKTATPTASPKVCFTATPGIKKVTLEWEDIEGATSYVVRYCKSGENTWKEESYFSGTSYTVTNLTAETEYQFVVIAYINGKRTEYTDNDIITMAPLPVPVPALPKVTFVPSLNQIALTWDSVEGATNYKVSYRRQGLSDWTNTITTTDTSYTLSGLSSLNKYDIIVTAYNDYCWSEYTDEDIITASSVPMEKPEITVETGVNSYTITWKPISDAKNYSVYFRKSGESTWTTIVTDQTTFKSLGREGDTVYELAVTANNSFESSQFSDEDIVTAKPQNSVLRAESGIGCVNLTWDAIDGESGYYIYFHWDWEVEDCWRDIASLDASTTSYTIDDIPEGHTVFCKIISKRYFSSGISTNEITAMPLSTAEKTVPALNVTPVSGGAEVTWDAISGADMYWLYVYGSNGLVTEMPVYGTSQTVTGLTPGQSYGFVAISHINGEWDFSWTADDLAYAFIPSEKTVPVLNVTPVSGGAEVTWDAIPGADMYWLYVYGANGLVTEMPVYGTSQTVTGLTPGQSYGFVAISYINGAWDFSWTVDDLAYAFVPPERTVPVLNVTPVSGGANVSWDAVPGAGMYWLYVFGANGLVTEMPVYGTNTAVTGLTPGQSYGFVAISYINGAWDFSWTVDDLAYAFIMPDKTVPVLNVTPVSGGANVSWDTIPGAYMYWLYVFGANGLVTEMPVYGTSAAVTGLTSGQGYAFVAVSYINGAWDFNWTADDLVYSAAG